MNEKNKEEIIDLEGGQDRLVPLEILDKLDMLGKPYLIVIRETDSVIAKKLNSTKIETHTNMVGDAYLNTLQSAYRIFVMEQQKIQKEVKDDKDGSKRVL